VLKIARKLWLVIFIFMSVMGTTNVVTAEENNKIEIQNQNTLGKTNLRNDVTVEINNLIAVPVENGKVISFTLHVKNNSNEDLNFIDYWVELKTKTGTNIAIQAVDSDVKTIPAQTVEDIVFFGRIGDSIELSDLIFNIIKWNFKDPTFRDVLGQISVPKTYNPEIKSGNGTYVNINNVKAFFQIKQVTIGKSNKQYKPEIKLIIKNEGKNTISLPEYNLYIMTGNKYLYPLNMSNMKDTKLDPLTSKEFSMTTSIPIEVDESNWKLVIMNTLSETKKIIPVAIFELKKTLTSVENDNNKTYTFVNEDGIYNVKLNSINKLPFEDNDLVIVNMTLENNSDVTLPMPNLTGKIIFNEKIEKKASITNNHKVIALSPGMKTDIQMLGSVPYTFNIDKLNIVLQQSDTNDSIDLLEISSDAIFQSIPVVRWDKGFKINDIGFRSDVKIKKQMIFKGSNSNIMAAQVIIKSEEKRVTSLYPLAGYFEKNDGTIYPATIQVIPEKINPNGSVLAYITTSIPKNIDSNDIKLVLGKAILDSGNKENSTDQDVIAGYVDPYSIILPPEQEEQESLKNIEIDPFNLSLNRVGTRVNFESSVIQLEMNYTLEQDVLIQSELKNQKIVFEIYDQAQNTSYEKGFSLPIAREEVKEDTLQTGTQTIKATWTDPDLAINIRLLQNFQFNVYYEIQPGYKKLIATQEIPWLVDRVITK